ncbi:MAG: ABC transporter permease [Patescibacteria group bacterium]|nr:ABC transporter permease [Patescibacteria group bacterium]
MTTKDLAHETLSALTANKVRTALTMLGIVIGISSVIVMVAIGSGAQSSIQANIQQLGSNLIEIMPGAQRSFGYGASGGRGGAQTLTPDDAAAIQQQVSNISYISPEMSGRYQVTGRGTNTNTSVNGVMAAYADVHNVDMAEGSFITDQNSASLSHVAVIGPTVASDLFASGTDPVGQTIAIKGIQFTVIGETVSKGTSGGFNNQDDVIYIPLKVAQLLLVGKTTYLTSVSISATSPDVMTQVQDDITNLLLDRHHISDPTQADFNVLNQASIVSAASSVTGTFTMLLAAVAGISLVVGGIGIMNMMLTTVTERTREIGLRKAIGATRHDINVQFLFEAVALTVIGGGIGVFLGWLVSYVVTRLGVLQTNVSISSILLAFGVSAAIGIVFGYYPARRASRLNPIEALRYE